MSNKNIEKYFDTKKIPLQDIIRLFKREGIENFVIVKREKFENVLSELEKLKNENNTLIEQNARMSERHFKDMGKLKELERYKKENNNLKLKLAEMYKASGEYEKAKSIMTKELRDIENKDKELEIKDKMIDLMAERIEQDNEIEFYCNGDFSCSFIDGICKESDEYKENYHISCIECIKEHFRNEVLKDE